MTRVAAMQFRVKDDWFFIAFFGEEGSAHEAYIREMVIESQRPRRYHERDDWADRFRLVTVPVYDCDPGLDFFGHDGIEGLEVLVEGMPELT